MRDLLAEIIALALTLGLLSLPILLCIKIIRAILKTLKKLIRKSKAKHYNTPGKWKSEWTWNKETQLWEHPRSKKNVESSNPTEIKIIIPDNLEEIIQKAKHEENEKRNKEEPTKIDEKSDIINKHVSSFVPRIIYTYPKAELINWDKEDINTELDFKTAYQRKELFTRNEWQNYKKLKSIAEKRGLVVCPKVRLFDIIEPRANKKQKLSFRYKIQAKHVDFIVCDQSMHIKAIIELDDNSHYDPERIKRDEFVNTILQSVGYTVIHTLYIENNILDLI